MEYPRNRQTLHDIVDRGWSVFHSQLVRKPTYIFLFSQLVLLSSITAAYAIDFVSQTPTELASTSPTDIVVANLNSNNDNFLDMAVAMSATGGGDGTVSFLFGNAFQ